MPIKLLSGADLFIVSAPSGAGKTTLCQRLTRTNSKIKHSIAYTTRLPRRGEIDNVHYSFVSKKRFKGMISRGDFAEWAVVHGNLYGTSIKRLQEINRQGYDIILAIDTNGAAQMKRKIRDAVYIFILPPSMKILKQRLEARMSDSPEEIKRRLEKAKDEIENYKKYDYVIVNDDFKQALKELSSIVTSRRLMTARTVPGQIKKLASNK